MSHASNRKRSDVVDPTATVLFEPHSAPVAPLGVEGFGHISIEVIGGPMDGLRCRAVGECLTIGRSTDNDLTLPLDLMVSSHHAVVKKEGDHFWLEDLDSRNGTFFGDRQLVTPTLVTPGATFVVGRTHLEFMPA